MGNSPLAALASVLTEQSTLSALATVLAVDLYASYRANEAAFRSRGNSRRGSVTLTDRFLDENVQTLEGIGAYVAPVVLTLTLLGLFFFLGSIGAVLTAFTALSSVFAAIFFLWPVGEFAIHVLRKSGCPIPAVEDGVPELCVLLPVALTVVSIWLFSGHWMANNLLGVFTCILFGALFRVHSLRVAVTLFIGLFAYDVFFVFFSERFFGKNVMLEVATTAPRNPAAAVASWLSLPFTPVQNLALPAKLEFPDGHGGFAILGLGDVMLPVILLVYLLAADLRLDIPLRTGLCARGVAAHCVALVVSFYCNVAAGIAQPALFYIVPCMLAVTILSAKSWGVLTQLWDGSLGRREYSELSQGPLLEPDSQAQDKDALRMRP